MRNLHRRFVWHYIGQIYGGDFAKFCGLLRIYELYLLHREWYKRFLEECPEGVLRKPDMVAMYSQILPQEDPSVIIEHLFRIFDRDNDGTIDFKEFVLATEITTSGQPEEKLRWTFKVQLLIKERRATVSETRA